MLDFWLVFVYDLGVPYGAYKLFCLFYSREPRYVNRQKASSRQPFCLVRLATEKTCVLYRRFNLSGFARTSPSKTNVFVENGGKLGRRFCLVICSAATTMSRVRQYGSLPHNCIEISYGWTINQENFTRGNCRAIYARTWDVSITVSFNRSGKKIKFTQ